MLRVSKKGKKQVHPAWFASTTPFVVFKQEVQRSHSKGQIDGLRDGKIVANLSCSTELPQSKATTTHIYVSCTSLTTKQMRKCSTFMATNSFPFKQILFILIVLRFKTCSTLLKRKRNCNKKCWL